MSGKLRFCEFIWLFINMKTDQEYTFFLHQPACAMPRRHNPGIKHAKYLELWGTQVEGNPRGVVACFNRNFPVCDAFATQIRDFVILK